MPKFRKKPVVVEAYQFHPWLELKAMPGVQKRYPDADEHLMSKANGVRVEFVVVTAHGQETFVANNDWIIAEPDGRGHYPCKSDIFEATYEPVE